MLKDGAITDIRLRIGPQERVIGPQTLAAAMAVDLVNLINRTAMYHEQFYRSLSTFETFERGWIKREDQTRKQAVDMG